MEINDIYVGKPYKYEISWKRTATVLGIGNGEYLVKDLNDKLLMIPGDKVFNDGNGIAVYSRVKIKTITKEGTAVVEAVGNKEVFLKVDGEYTRLAPECIVCEVESV